MIDEFRKRLMRELWKFLWDSRDTELSELFFSIEWFWFIYQQYVSFDPTKYPVSMSDTLD